MRGREDPDGRVGRGLGGRMGGAEGAREEGWKGGRERGSKGAREEGWEGEREGGRERGREEERGGKCEQGTRASLRLATPNKDNEDAKTHQHGTVGADRETGRASLARLVPLGDLAVLDLDSHHVLRSGAAGKHRLAVSRGAHSGAEQGGGRATVVLVITVSFRLTPTRQRHPQATAPPFSQPSPPISLSLSLHQLLTQTAFQPQTRG